MRTAIIMRNTNMAKTPYPALDCNNKLIIILSFQVFIDNGLLGSKIVVFFIIIHESVYFFILNGEESLIKTRRCTHGRTLFAPPFRHERSRIPLSCLRRQAEQAIPAACKGVASAPPCTAEHGREAYHGQLFHNHFSY